MNEEQDPAPEEPIPRDPVPKGSGEIVEEQDPVSKGPGQDKS